MQKDADEVEESLGIRRRSGGRGKSGTEETRPTTRSIPIDNRIYGGKLVREGDRIGRWKCERGPEMEAVPCWQTLRLYLSLFYSALSSSASLFLSRSDPCAYPLPPDYSFSLLRPYGCVLSSVNSVKPRGSGSG